MTDSRMRPASYDGLNGWLHDDHAQAFAAFVVSAKRMQEKAYKTRALGQDGNILKRIGAIAVAQPHQDGPSARAFFERYFKPHFLIPDAQQENGFMTGFFEPEMEAALTQSALFPEPLYARPPELVDLDDSNRGVHLGASYRYGWQTPEGVVESPDRDAINKGALKNRGLEIAWLRNKVDAFFVHVQGAAKLTLPSGEALRVTYSAKSGHPYTSLGRLLCERLGVTLADMTSDILRDWMLNNPEKLDELLAHNRSYIFFESSQHNEVNTGPIAAAKVPLIRHRSLAVDRSLHTFGVPFFVSTRTPLPSEDAPFRKLMIAHDTGSAIVGTARGDIFCGTGDEAGLQAGRIQHDADMVVLMPNAEAL